MKRPGAPYEIKIIDFKKNEQKSPEYLKINPMGKLPAIVHKGVVVTENSAICAYLADAFPAAALAPKISDPLRGSYFRWLAFGPNCLEAAVLDKNVPRKIDLPPMSLGYGTYEIMQKTLESAVADGFVVDNKFSAADLYLSSYLDWFFFQKWIEPTPILSKYVELCTSRPAYKRIQEQMQKFM